ncbi:MAG: glycosyltransferase family 4 protein [Luteolibacter sp.]
MLRILISAYACEPDRGSEPSVGWEWATRLPEHHRVTVITRANNRESIERELRRKKPDNRADFIYHDLPQPCIWLKKKGLLPVFAYYLLWQLSIRLKLSGQLGEFDLIHHVTFNAFRFPGAWWFTKIPIVLGPLGGGSITSPVFRRCYGNRWWKEVIRSISIKVWKLNPWTVASLRSADMVLAVGDEMEKRLGQYSATTRSMLETAIPTKLEDITRFQSTESKRHFLVVGNIEPWKGWQIAMEAFANMLPENTDDNLIFIGRGSQENEAKCLAEGLGISERIQFTGHMDREKLWQRIFDSKALVFPSVRETSGNAALEAMALGCPVICFAHQGIGWITNEECAIRIQPSSWNDSVNDFSEAMAKISSNRELGRQLGTNARELMINQYSWQQKMEAISQAYQSITNGYHGHD